MKQLINEVERNLKISKLNQVSESTLMWLGGGEHIILWNLWDNMVQSKKNRIQTLDREIKNEKTMCSRPKKIISKVKVKNWESGTNRRNTTMHRTGN